MLTESEISALLERKLPAMKQEMVNAWMAFQRNPTAKIFKASEDIPDKLTGEVLDEEVLASPTLCKDVVVEVLRESYEEARDLCVRE